MINGVTVHFNVINLERAIHFYVEVLGATLVKHPVPEWALLKLGPLELGLLVTTQRAPYIQRGEFGSRSGATLTLLSTDITEDRQRLEKGGAVIFRHEKSFWGEYLLFEDTEGNVLRFLERPTVE